MSSITPVVLTGGIGSRLWPVSRKSLPKQFAHMFGAQTLFQESVRRVRGKGFLKPLILASEEHRFLVSQQLLGLGVEGDVVLEPQGKNTAPAIIAAAIIAQKRDLNAMILVLPSDHHIPDTNAFCEAVTRGKRSADSGDVVVFGVRPTCAETGYGYIETETSEENGIKKVTQFHEKPEKLLATKMYNSGRYLWNAGIFLARTDCILGMASQFQSSILTSVQKAVDNGNIDLDYFRFSADAWLEVEPISFDYAIMEKAKNVSCVEFDSGWSDMGNWGSVANLMPLDEHNNVISPSATAVDCSNTTLWSSANRVHLTGLGLENIVAVATDDAVLVASVDRLQEVGSVVEALEVKSAPEAKQHLKDYRPWGWFESIVLAPNYQVKRLHIHPGSSLSLQSHQHRSEHWVVVSGTATVVRDEETMYLETNSSVYINAGQKHRLSNETDVPLVVIEVQTGGYLSEDDIIRYEDLYQRHN